MDTGWREMKRSEINDLIRSAKACWDEHGWTLPPEPQWDVTDFGLGDWQKFGLVLVNLANEPEYCEKLMYVQRGMVTPPHTHIKKKEDIICRWGTMTIDLWSGAPESEPTEAVSVKVNGKSTSIPSGSRIQLRAGERVTLLPGTYHQFEGTSDECIIGEVSTANDDVHDNFFSNPEIGRFSEIIEDEPPIERLVNEQ